MCFHDDDLSYTVIKAFKNTPSRAVISFRRPDGALIGAWVCDPRDEREIARTMRELRAWHPDQPGWMDLWHVNMQRHMSWFPFYYEEDGALYNGPVAASAEATPISGEITALLKRIAKNSSHQAFA